MSKAKVQQILNETFESINDLILSFSSTSDKEVETRKILKVYAHALDRIENAVR